jgi:hypothetical protein
MTKRTIEFAPGCFDSFEGTQEELDEMIAEITKAFENGELDNSSPVDIDALMEEDPEMAEQLLRQLDAIEDDKPRRLN